MISDDISRAVLEHRLELARRLVESVILPAPLNDAVAEGIRRIEDVAAGRVTPLTEEQFRAYALSVGPSQNACVDVAFT